MATTASPPLPQPPSKQPPDTSKCELQAHKDRVIKALAATAEKEFPELADRPLEKWFNSVEALVRQVEMNKETERIDQAYILAFRAINMGEVETT
jgi:hypothetical protein